MLHWTERNFTSWKSLALFFGLKHNLDTFIPREIVCLHPLQELKVAAFRHDLTNLICRLQIPSACDRCVAIILNDSCAYKRVNTVCNNSTDCDVLCAIRANPSLAPVHRLSGSERDVGASLRPCECLDDFTEFTAGNGIAVNSGDTNNHALYSRAP